MLAVTATSTVGNPELQGALYVNLGDCEFTFGQYDQAIQTLTKAAELCEAAGNMEEAGHAYAYLQLSHLYKGSFAPVLTLKKDLLRTMEQCLNLRWYVRGLSAASRAYICLGRWNEAIKEGKNALSIAEEYSDKSQISFAAWTLSVAYSFKGDLSRAVEYGELAVQKAPPGGDKAWAQRYLGWALC